MAQVTSPHVCSVLLTELIPFMAGRTINVSVLTDLDSGRRGLETGMVRSLAITVPGKDEAFRAIRRTKAREYRALQTLRVPRRP